MNDADQKVPWENGAERSWRPNTSLLRNAHRELRGSRQVRVARRVLLDPLAELLGWRLGDPETIQTSEGEEDGSQPLFLNGSEKAAARALAIPAEASLDLSPERLHRRFAPAHSLVRVLEQEGLTWGILRNAYGLRVVRRSEGFVSSHLASSLLDLAADVPGARGAWRLLWGLLRGDAWHPAPTLLNEVVHLGREHQQEVGGILGSQVPAAVERLLQGALEEHRAALRLNPYYPLAHNNLGIPLVVTPGRLSEAIPHLQAALRLKPTSAEIHNSLSSALSLALGRAGGNRRIQNGVAVQPNDPDTQYNLGLALSKVPEATRR